MESFQLTGIVAASPVAVQIVQYMRLSTEPVELLLEVYVGWYYSNQGLLILSTNTQAGIVAGKMIAPTSLLTPRRLWLHVIKMAT